MSETSAVTDANARFYAAFRSGDTAAMDAVWAETGDVTCIHPGWPRLSGRPPVLASWRRVLDADSRPNTCAAPMPRSSCTATWRTCCATS